MTRLCMKTKNETETMTAGGNENFQKSRVANDGSGCLRDHAYVRKISPDKAVCLDCGYWIDLKVGKTDSVPLIMPPRLYELDKDVWPSWNPWPNILHRIAQKYGWYGSVIGMDDYLIMPIVRNKLIVGYSARRITDNGGKKYLLPSGRAKRPWFSWEFAGTRKDLPEPWPIFVAEGVADAAYLSALGPAMATLGTYAELPEQAIITVMDGDAKGIEAAFRLVQEQKKRGIIGSNAVILP